jgi:predicted HTH domain antitoxin
MSSTLTTRISDDLEAAIERIGEEEQLDKSAVTRRLLERAVREHERERAFERYEDGELSIEQLATEADMSLRQALTELRERGVHFSYSEESLREDLPDA